MWNMDDVLRLDGAMRLFFFILRHYTFCLAYSKKKKPTTISQATSGEECKERRGPQPSALYQSEGGGGREVIGREREREMYPRGRSFSFEAYTKKRAKANRFLVCQPFVTAQRREGEKEGDK